MRQRVARWTVLLAVLLAACVPVTVNINFPQEKLDAAAGQIVDMSRRPTSPAPEAPTPPAPGAAPKSPGSDLDRMLTPLAPREAEAASVRIDVAQAPRTDTPELRRLVESQNRRWGALQQWMTRGCIGESNQGLLEPRPGEGCAGDVARLIGEENRDRQAIVDTFIQQNHIAPSQAGQVRASFAKAYRDRAPGGTWVQSDRGDWARK
jgi:uncharacterized protein YdbL (DUF1318 family)